MNRLYWLAVAGIAVALPFLLDDYRTFQLTLVLTTALAVASLVLLTGWGGQLSAGQGALFGLGGYACGILVVTVGLPWPPAVLASAVVGLVGGLLFGLPARRLGGISVALVTLALAVLFPLLAVRLKGLTGGPFGLALPPVDTPSGIQLSSSQFIYLVCLGCLGLTLAGLASWCRGRTGRALDALRSDPLMARTQGIHTGRLSLLVAGVSGSVAGLGGALNAVVVGSVTPDAYTVNLSLALLTGAVVGGIRSWAGALIGAAYIVYVQQLASDLLGSDVAGQWSHIVYAATLLGALYFAPDGLAGLGRRLALLRRPGGPTGVQPAGPPDPHSPAPPVEIAIEIRGRHSDQANRARRTETVP